MQWPFTEHKLDLQESVTNDHEFHRTWSNLDDWVDITPQREAFITLKDHKQNFTNNSTCNLTNPAKSEIDNISKQILNRINTSLPNHLNLNQ